MGGFIRSFADHASKRWQANSRGYLSAFAPYLGFAFVASAADFGTTYYAMSVQGVENELHPVIRLVSVVLGPLVGPLVGKLAQCAALVVVTVMWRPYARIIFIPVTALYLYAAWFNVWGDLYTPLFLRLLAR